ncbi:hypothetical protein (nucleomorph) [Guillardia theta]|uniref:Uncharacterized protein n=1 Tax=Guillardia theta TaxID=55529 RepID=Q98S41_GUITH|nr:hypothetical protein GTHECHR3098 [Guillardia theta]AAK39742.1 hypothetical protein [Guillardia theta]
MNISLEEIQQLNLSSKFLTNSELFSILINNREIYQDFKKIKNNDMTFVYETTIEYLKIINKLETDCLKIRNLLDKTEITNKSVKIYREIILSKVIDLFPRNRDELYYIFPEISNYFNEMELKQVFKEFFTEI